MLSAGLTFATAVDMRSEAGLVGPNAVVQLAAALCALPDPSTAADVFSRAGLERLLASPPDAMIDERIPARLFATLWQVLPAEQAGVIAHDAGVRTGHYIIANRIPLAARMLLRALPARFAAPLLLQAIQRHAWTFAGSGTCRVAPGRPATITLERNPLDTPGCVWHVGVFECLFRSLVSRHTRVRHCDHRIDTAPACSFEIDIFP